MCVHPGRVQPRPGIQILRFVLIDNINHFWTPAVAEALAGKPDIFLPYDIRRCKKIPGWIYMISYNL